MEKSTVATGERAEMLLWSDHLAHYAAGIWEAGGQLQFKQYANAAYDCHQRLLELTSNAEANQPPQPEE